MKIEKTYPRWKRALGQGVVIAFTFATPVLSHADANEIRDVRDVHQDFDFETETFCFNNNGDSSHDRQDFSSTGILILGNLAAREGACHGISKLVASAHHNIQFECGGPAPSRRQVQEAFRKAVYLHDQRCTNRITLWGACNLRSLCTSPRIGTLRRLAVHINASRTLRGSLPGFTDGNANIHLRSERRQRRQNYRAIRAIHAKLRRNQSPLIFFQAGAHHRGHVVVATGIEFERLAQRRTTRTEWTHRVRILTADPMNRRRNNTLTYRVNTFDGLAYGGRGYVIRDPEPYRVGGNCHVFDRPRTSEFDIM